MCLLPPGAAAAPSQNSEVLDPGYQQFLADRATKGYASDDTAEARDEYQRLLLAEPERLRLEQAVALRNRPLMQLALRPVSPPSPQQLQLRDQQEQRRGQQQRPTQQQARASSDDEAERLYGSAAGRLQIE